MWLSFFFAFLALLVILYLPGGLISASIWKGDVKCLAASPIVSCSVYVVLGVLFGIVGISVPIACFFIVAVVISLFACLAIHFFDGRLGTKSASGLRRSRTDVALAILGSFLSLLILGYFYVKGLNGADSVMQQSDNTWHLGVIAQMLESGNLSVLSVSVRDGAAGGFYPAAWHIVCAICSSISGCSASISENATNYVFSGVVFPISAYAMVVALFPKETKVKYAVPVCAVASTAFPLGLYLFGPLYPNLAGMCCLPSIICMFTCVIQAKEKRFRLLLILLFSCIGLVALHPSSVFLGAIVLVPYCCSLLYKKALVGFSGKRLASFGAVAVFVSACAAAWALAFSLPAFKDTVGFCWPSITTGDQAIMDILFLSLRNGTPQFALSFLVCVGIVGSFALRRNRWAVAPFLFTSIQYYCCAATDGFLDSFLTGFWYTDQWRIAANVAFTSILLSCLGLSYVYKLVCAILSSLRDTSGIRDVSCAKKTLCFSCSLLFVILIYCPSFSTQIGSQETAYGYAGKRIEELNSGYSPTYSSYTNDERDFVKEAEKITGNDLVYNFKPDGSCFAYLEDGMNTFYRSYSDGGPCSIDQERLIRNRLGVYAFDQDVEQTAKDLGIKYVLELDLGDGFVDQGDTQWSINTSYKKSDWESMESINDETPGFDLVLSKGDMRLYKIAL